MEVIKAARQLAADGVPTEVISVTSWSELARDGLACEQRGRRGQAEAGRCPAMHATSWHIGRRPDHRRQATTCARCRRQSAPSSPAGRRYLTLGTDGFGRSHMRAALREFFGVDAAHIVKAVRHALSRRLSRE